MPHQSDEHPFRVGQVNKLIKDNYREWRRKLSASVKRPNVGGVLVILDSDVKVGGERFCAAILAKALAKEAMEAGYALVCDGDRLHGVG